MLNIRGNILDLLPTNLQIASSWSVHVLYSTIVPNSDTSSSPHVLVTYMKSLPLGLQGIPSIPQMRNKWQGTGSSPQLQGQQSSHFFRHLHSRKS